MDGWVYFSAETSDIGRELWRSNGATTELVADINTLNDWDDTWSSFPSYLEAMDGWVYFSASNYDVGSQLWRSNGVTTELVAEIDWDAYPSYLEAMDGWVYFEAIESGIGSELWRSNGITTELVADVYEGVESSSPSHLEAMGGWVYFIAGPFGHELWRSNGVTTELVAEIDPDVRVEARDLTALDGWLYFTADSDGDEIRELWRSNGTVTHRVGGELVFSGFVDSSRVLGPKWTRTFYTPPVTGEHTFILDWEGDANLLISVKEYETGTWIGDNVTTDQPKTLTVDLDAGVEYKVAVWAKTGAAEFTVHLQAPPAPAGEEIFAGTVDAERIIARKWVRTIYTPELTGDYSFTLDWDGDANLRISVKEYVSGTWIGENISTDHPKTVTVPLDAGVEYKIAVWSFSGAADFTLTAYPPG